MKTELEPCTIVIFGASGDLTERKLIPALFDLHRTGGLPERFAIVGVARTDLSDETFRAKVAPDIGDPQLRELWTSFAGHLHYQSLRYGEVEDYRALDARLVEVSEEHGAGANRLFNLAIPPTLYEQVARRLAEAGLSAERAEGRGWVRLVVEKPFGSDLASALELDWAIRKGFDEHQVFRIDHYLAKETVQNILMFRFANAIFEPIWNRNYIDHVRIVATESLGVEHRAGYYESAGVLRDMFQNHMMQLLSLVAIEPPSLYGADNVRDEKVKLFGALRPFPLGDKYDLLVLGQYAAGREGERTLPAYRDEPGVDPASLTPTYAMMSVFVDNWRWQGVPFYLTSGKRLREKVTKVEIYFRPVPHSLFRDLLGDRISANRLTLGIYPNEEIVLHVEAKTPGARASLRPVRLRFDYYEGYDGPVVEAYGKALGDALRGDHMLFWRQDALELTWAYLEPIINACETCEDRGTHLHDYPAGGDGPEAARAMLPSYGDGQWL